MKTKKVVDHIVLWLSDYLDKSGLKGFVIGVSGGIDSAVTSCLCAKTGKPVLALNMPIYQAKDQVSRSFAHNAWLKKKFDNVNTFDMELSPVFDQIKDSFPESIQDDMTMANTRSRLRMLTLYAFASSHKMLVAGTGNKIEDFGVGFYTKHGDGGVDLSPIADLTKTQVYDLGKDLGIMEDILTAHPTDGLWEDNRTDESQIGASYAELEWAMQHLDAPQKGPLNSRQKQVVSIYKKFHMANKHKMDPIPICSIPKSLKE
ncbi:MAG: NAD(+) synthase [Desulfobacula sp.]|jgi:NAD+ synthase|uniref:NAD(+) synthase n=1 Tax=Desulfobacula sp. TaxID=2593537 RepID=UPI001DA73541|nr:NAD(+) synthase [Desulfobacula sp.]MBT3484016.1 NAD(+) synthase [Desulfobacula sp.]MBT3805958.1 NAD(+) synthase [Desulfobacula sp.]MBT4026357.1 NAD(+) synthase [Desulfobacula sp.]MBT4198098.1 NAD(+) synthase [Desulfobacula sp.]